MDSLYLNLLAGVLSLCSMQEERFHICKDDPEWPQVISYFQTSYPRERGTQPFRCLREVSGKFQEGFSLASPEQISVVKRWVFSLASLGHVHTFKPIYWLRRWSDLIGQTWILCSWVRSSISPVSTRWMGLNFHRMVNDYFSNGCQANITVIHNITSYFFWTKSMLQTMVS